MCDLKLSTETVSYNEKLNTYDICVETIFSSSLNEIYAHYTYSKQYANIFVAL